MELYCYVNDKLSSLSVVLFRQIFCRYRSLIDIVAWRLVINSITCILHKNRDNQNRDTKVRCCYTDQNFFIHLYYCILLVEVCDT